MMTRFVRSGTSCSLASRGRQSWWQQNRTRRAAAATRITMLADPKRPTLFLRDMLMTGCSWIADHAFTAAAPAGPGVRRPVFRSVRVRLRSGRKSFRPDQEIPFVTEHTVYPRCAVRRSGPADRAAEPANRRGIVEKDDRILTKRGGRGGGANPSIFFAIQTQGGVAFALNDVTLVVGEIQADLVEQRDDGLAVAHAPAKRIDLKLDRRRVAFCRIVQGGAEIHLRRRLNRLRVFVFTSDGAKARDGSSK